MVFDMIYDDMIRYDMNSSMVYLMFFNPWCFMSRFCFMVMVYSTMMLFPNPNVSDSYTETLIYACLYCYYMACFHRYIGITRFIPHFNLLVWGESSNLICLAILVFQFLTQSLFLKSLHFPPFIITFLFFIFF